MSKHIGIFDQDFGDFNKTIKTSVYNGHEGVKIKPGVKTISRRKKDLKNQFRNGLISTEEYENQLFKIEQENLEFRVQRINQVKNSKNDSLSEYHEEDSDYEKKINRLLRNKQLELERQLGQMIKIYNDNVYELNNPYTVSDLQHFEFSIFTKLDEYEKIIRSEGYFGKIRLNIVLIEDMKNFRDDTMNILVKELGDGYSLEFEEIDTYHIAEKKLCGLKETNFLIKSVLENTIIILDFNIPMDLLNKYKIIKTNKLYERCTSYDGFKEKFIKNTVVLSSDTKVSDYFPEGTNIISGKGNSSIDYILKLSDFIKNKYEK